MQAITSGVAYGLRFTAYFPCITGQGRFAVIDSTSVQPGPTHEPAYGPIEVLSLPPNNTAGIGRGADVGISTRTRLFGALAAPSFVGASWAAGMRCRQQLVWMLSLHACCWPSRSDCCFSNMSSPVPFPFAGKFTRVSSIQATDIAVDPTDPANIWCVAGLTHSIRAELAPP